MSICNRNRIMTGLRFLFRVTLRRLDLPPRSITSRAAEDPAGAEPGRDAAPAGRRRSLKVRLLLSLGYGCGLRAGEVVRLKVKHIDSAQKIIRIEQAKGRKDRNVMLSPETLDLLRQWWKARPTRYDAGTRAGTLAVSRPQARQADDVPASSIACSMRRPRRPGSGRA